ncbi:ASST-domain-containing protein [Xylariomycetidae sp. FL0641]|nr:ASST-domain-containing protein [Xylariomycetidae sp. FL0641]
MNAFSSTVSSGAKLNVPHDEDLVPLKLKSSGQQSQAQNDGLVARQMPGNGAFDAYHINSIDKTKDGNYLVSLRLLALAVLIDGTTGEPIWHLGDVLNDFEDLSGGNATNFSYQHHIRFHNDETELTIFDNHDADQSRGLHLKLDQDAMTVEVITEAYHPAAVYAAAMGSEVLLPNTDLFTGYGAQPTFTVHNTAGECLLEGWWHSSAGGGMASNYRYFWVPAENWIAQPTTSPDVAVEDATVYVSWNGATEVASWVVYNRNDESVATAARDGFETAIDIPGVSGDVYVEALDASGKVLGTSATATATATAKRSVAFRG